MASQWHDDETLLAELSDVARWAGSVPDSVRSLGRAAFGHRAGGTLAVISYDSVLDDTLYRAGEEPTGPRLLAFQADALSVEVELAGDRVFGQVVPPVPADVQLQSVDGVVGETETDPIGCFVLPRPEPGPVRFRCCTTDGVVLTDWVRI